MVSGMPLPRERIILEFRIHSQLQLARIFNFTTTVSWLGIQMNSKKYIKGRRNDIIGENMRCISNMCDRHFGKLCNNCKRVKLRWMKQDRLLQLGSADLIK